MHRILALLLTLGPASACDDEAIVATKIDSEREWIELRSRQLVPAGMPFCAGSGRGGLHGRPSALLVRSELDDELSARRRPPDLTSATIGSLTVLFSAERHGRE